MVRKSHLTWKEDNVERMEAHSTNVEKLGHSQKWMKNTEHNDSHGASPSLSLF
jgi:hypothetical protein